MGIDLDLTDGPVPHEERAKATAETETFIEGGHLLPVTFEALSPDSIKDIGADEAPWLFQQVKAAEKDRDTRCYAIVGDCIDARKVSMTSRQAKRLVDERPKMNSVIYQDVGHDNFHHFVTVTGPGPFHGLLLRPDSMPENFDRNSGLMQLAAQIAEETQTSLRRRGLVPPAETETFIEGDACVGRKVSTAIGDKRVELPSEAAMIMATGAPTEECTPPGHLWRIKDETWTAVDALELRLPKMIERFRNEPGLREFVKSAINSAERKSEPISAIDDMTGEHICKDV